MYLYTHRHLGEHSSSASWKIFLKVDRESGRLVTVIEQENSKHGGTQAVGCICQDFGVKKQAKHWKMLGANHTKGTISHFACRPKLAVYCHSQEIREIDKNLVEKITSLHSF